MPAPSAVLTSSASAGWKAVHRSSSRIAPNIRPEAAAAGNSVRRKHPVVKSVYRRVAPKLIAISNRAAAARPQVMAIGPRGMVRARMPVITSFLATSSRTITDPLLLTFNTL